MKILTEDHIACLVAENFADHGDDHAFARAIEAAIIAKIGEPVGWVQRDPDGNLYPQEITHTKDSQPLDQWDRQMGWTVEPLYRLPEIEK